MFLLFAVLTSAAIPLIFKISHKRNIKPAVMLAGNYIMATIVSLIFLLQSGIHKDVISSSGGKIAIGLGAITGILYYGGFVFYQKSVKKEGASIASAVGKMGILIPMIFSAVIWKELPENVQWFGIIIAIVAILMMTLEKGTRLNKSYNSVLLLFFIIGGLGDFASKIYQVYGLKELNSLFIFCIFVTALVISCIHVIRNKELSKENLESLVFGFIIGIPNQLTSMFLLLSLGQLSVAIVYPTYSGGTIVVANIVSILIMGERVTKRQLLGILMTIIAVVLINF